MPIPNGDQNNTERDPNEDARLDEEARRNAQARAAENPRLAAMDAIAAANAARVDEQLRAEGLETMTPIGDQSQTHTPSPPPPPVDLADDTTRRTPPAPKPSTTATPAPSTPAPPAAPAFDLSVLTSGQPIPMEALDHIKVRVKIDGEEREVTVHELRRTAQLDGAAHKRLEQANVLLQQAREAAARTGQPLPSGGTPAPSPHVGVAPPPPSPQSPPANATAAMTDLVQALFTGDQEVAMAKLAELLPRPQQPAHDVASIAAQVAPVVRQQLSEEEANAQFRSCFQDIVGDPILVSAADRFFDEVMAESPQKPYAEALNEAGNRTRTWLEARTGKPATATPAPPSSQQQRLERKRQIDEVRPLNRTATTADPQPQTNSQIIAEMAAQRGLRQ